MTHKNEALPRATAGLESVSILGRCDSKTTSPNALAAQAEIRNPIGAHEAHSDWLRLKFLAARLHALGPAPLAYFLNEIEAGANLWWSLEIYAALTGDLIRANGGDQFTRTLCVVDGGAT